MEGWVKISYKVNKLGIRKTLNYHNYPVVHPLSARTLSRLLQAINVMSDYRMVRLRWAPGL